MAFGSKVFGFRFVLAFGIWVVMILAQTQICQFNILFIFNEQTLWIAHILWVCDYHTTPSAEWWLCARTLSMTWFTTVNFEFEVCVADAFQCVCDWRHSRTHSDASAIKPNKQTTLDAMYIPITICSKPDWMIEFHIFIDWFRLISQCFGWFCCILYVLLSVWSACLPLSDCSSARTFHFYVDAIWLYELVWAKL